jgi:hypothetical protein
MAVDAVTAVEGLRTVSLWQPYASLVACGAKTWETRGYRAKPGRIGIAATIKPRPEEAAEVALPAIHDALWPALGFDRRPMPTCVRERLPRGVLLATAELVDCCPIGGPYSFRTGSVEGDEGDHPGQAVVVHHPASGLGSGAGPHPPYHCVDDPTGPPYHLDITDQLPFGIWDPGRWAWRLADIKPTTERCPWCWGDGGFREDSMVLYGVAGGEDWADPCPVCNPGGRRTEPLGVGAYGCAPVPVKGKQGPWTWRPEAAA